MSYLLQVNRKFVQEVLDGEYGKLTASFYWSGTPHGGEYWAARCVGAEELSDDDKAYLKSLLED